MNSGWLDLPAGTKFSAIGLEPLRLASGMPATLHIRDDLVVSSSFPTDALAHWASWLGRLQTKRVKAADLWLIARRPTDHPEAHDRDSSVVAERSNELYNAFLIAVPNVSHNEAVRLSGRRSASDLRVSGAQVYPAIRHVPFAPERPIDRADLELTATIADAFPAIKHRGEFRRKWRVVRAFHTGLQSQELGERIHQFVRCVEGFIFPRRGSTREDFADRTKVLLGAGWEDDIRQIFDIRSAVEHLHGPYRFLPPLGKPQRLRLLARRAVQAEFLARSCLIRFFTRNELWRFYEDNQTIEVFWTRMSDSERRAAWGPPLDLSLATQGFREEWIEAANKDS